MLCELVTNLLTWSLLAVGLVSYLWMSRGPKVNVPPSPGPALPIIGHLYMIEKNPRKQLVKWSKELGDLFSLQMGFTTVVVVSGIKTLKQLFVNRADQFNDRPGVFINEALEGGRRGIVFSNGSNWKEQRSTALCILREFGMGKNILAAKIAEEVCYFMDGLGTLKGQSTNIKHYLRVSVSNVICSILFGKRYDHDDPQLNKLIDMYSQSITFLGGTALIQFFPILKHLPFDLFGAKAVVENDRNISEFIRDIMRSKIETLDTKPADSFISAYLNEMRNRNTSGKATQLDGSFGYVEETKK